MGKKQGRPEGYWINRKCYPLENVMVSDLATIIKGGGKVKPLPPEFASIDPARVKRFVPENRFFASIKGCSPVGERVVLDPDAAFGFAATTYLPEQQPQQKLPFTFGCRPALRAPSVKRSVKIEEIKPGIYRLYKLGAVTITPASDFWMPEWSGSTSLEIGKRLYEPGAENCWEVYVSLKFDGPTYGGQAGEDRVWSDQVILVRKSEDQFKRP